MRFLKAATLLAAIVMGQSAAAGDLASGDTLRAVYLGSNPTQASRDPATGELRGPAYVLARDLANRHGLKLEFRALGDPPSVIEAVRTGAADLGFVAYEATRLGTVSFSQTYMLVRQTFLVLNSSPLRSVAEIDRSGLRIAGTPNDSITLCLGRTLKQAKLVELANDAAVLGTALQSNAADAIGANRQRLTTLMRATPNTRLLTDDLFSVPQNVVVPKDRPEALDVVNAAIDELRTSGSLQAAIVQGGAVGTLVAPAGSVGGCPQA